MIKKSKEKRNTVRSLQYLRGELTVREPIVKRKGKLIANMIEEEE